jgi:hypothetical protein
MRERISIGIVEDWCFGRCSYRCEMDLVCGECVQDASMMSTLCDGLVCTDWYRYIVL